MPQYKVSAKIHRFGYKGKRYLSGETVEAPADFAAKIPHILEPIIPAAPATTSRAVETASKRLPEKPEKVEKPLAQTQPETRASEVKDRKTVKG